MSKEIILGIPKDILAKPTNFIIRKHGVFSIVSGTVGTGLGITNAVLGENPLTSAMGIGVGIVSLGVHIDVNRWVAKLTFINNRLDNIIKR